ncbi:hypothetical protein OPS25_00800 [Alteromonas ponticola]|uniref:Uncharacterized protein n=1 Tax=Alteromonas aquimaris TaxID=2998417 RepID=A0ABT3P3B5_9ALTE|nr:hypothetical protein [Alteromonas aquimaris]MCW8107040.1 hypothetical protein [Alteromonas aquimaris]
MTVDKTQYVQQGTQEYHTSLVTDMNSKALRVGEAKIDADMAKALDWLRNYDIEYRSYSSPRYDQAGNLASLENSYFGTLIPPPITNGA